MKGRQPRLANAGVDLFALQPLGREQHQFRALLVWCGLNRQNRPFLLVGFGGVALGQHLLDRGQRDHLAAQLDESLEPAAEDQHAVGLFADQIARAVPRLAVELDEGGFPLVVQIPAEDAGAANQQHPRAPCLGTFAGVDVHDSMFE